MDERRNSIIPPITNPVMLNKTMKLHKHLHIMYKEKSIEHRENNNIMNTPGHQKSIIVDMEQSIKKSFIGDDVNEGMFGAILNHN